METAQQIPFTVRYHDLTMLGETPTVEPYSKVLTPASEKPVVMPISDGSVGSTQQGWAHPSDVDAIHEQFRSDEAHRIELAELRAAERSGELTSHLNGHAKLFARAATVAGLFITGQAIDAKNAPSATAAPLPSLVRAEGGEVTTTTTTTETRTIEHGSAAFFLSAKTAIEGTATSSATLVGPAHRKKATKASKEVNKDAEQQPCKDKIPETAGDTFRLCKGALVKQEFRKDKHKNIVWGTRPAQAGKDTVWHYNKKTGNYENWTTRADGTRCINILFPGMAPIHVGPHTRKPKAVKHKDAGAVYEIGDEVSAKFLLAVKGIARTSCGGEPNELQVDASVEAIAKAIASAKGKFTISSEDKVRVERDANAKVATDMTIYGNVKCEKDYSSTTTTTTTTTTSPAPTVSPSPSESPTPTPTGSKSSEPTCRPDVNPFCLPGANTKPAQSYAKNPADYQN